MQEVKIYTASPSDLSPPVQSESFCVDTVLASDYAELEAKYAALADLFGDVKEIFGFKYRYFISSKGLIFNGFWQAKTVKPFYARQEQKSVFVR
ncbi:hypothetical protein [Salmonella enterica]|uniref:hypothetical protein n=1 Tax=Salmonella enterica TaxID=28901 RepID=UPI0035231E45